MGIDESIASVVSLLVICVFWWMILDNPLERLLTHRRKMRELKLKTIREENRSLELKQKRQITQDNPWSES